MVDDCIKIQQSFRLIRQISRQYIILQMFKINESGTLSSEHLAAHLAHEIFINYRVVYIIWAMMRKTSHSKQTKAQELLKNFSRSPSSKQKTEPDVFTKGLKTRKVAFTSRMIHATKNNPEQLALPHFKRQFTQPPDEKQLNLSQIVRNDNPFTYRINSLRAPEKKVDDKTNPWKRKARLMSPKILPIAVNSLTKIPRVQSASSHRKFRVRNGELKEPTNSFLFTFGAQQRL